MSPPLEHGRLPRRHHQLHIARARDLQAHQTMDGQATLLSPTQAKPRVQHQAQPEKQRQELHQKRGYVLQRLVYHYTQ